METNANFKLPSTRVCARYDITRRTLNRWMTDPSLGFPEPLTINGRHYFEEHALETWERKRAAISRTTRHRAPSPLTGTLNQPTA